MNTNIWFFPKQNKTKPNPPPTHNCPRVNLLCYLTDVIRGYDSVPIRDSPFVFGRRWCNFLLSQPLVATESPSSRQISPFPVPHFFTLSPPPERKSRLSNKPQLHCNPNTYILRKSPECSLHINPSSTFPSPSPFSLTWKWSSLAPPPTDISKIEEIFADEQVFDFFVNPTIETEKKRKVVEELPLLRAFSHILATSSTFWSMSRELIWSRK